MENFNIGDRVTLTRQSRSGRTFILSGVLTSVAVRGGRLDSGAIRGQANGKLEHSHFDLDAERMLRLYGVEQSLILEPQS